MRKIPAIFYLAIILCPLKLVSQSIDTLNKEISESSFKIISIEKGLVYRKIESSYQVLNQLLSRNHEYYLARFKKTTFKSESLEGQNRTIEVSISPLDKLDSISYYINRTCDDIELFPDYYRTIKYGCCLLLNEIKLYDYSNNLIISGSDKIFRGEIPNNKISFYLAYQEPIYDSLSFGMINISFNSKDKYHILLRGNQKILVDSDGVLIYPVLYPQIKMNLKHHDQFDNDETYTFWSMMNINSVSEINLSFSLKFECASSIFPITIPIINGKPFGNNAENQVYQVKFM
jgi:hypothetical protein